MKTTKTTPLVSSAINKLILTALATFMLHTVRSATVIVPSTSDIWLAGMTNGANAYQGDFAPLCSPAEVLGVAIVPGTSLTFSATGATAQGHSPSLPLIGPDGDTNSLAFRFGNAQNGISNITNAPIDSLIGVFLGSDLPILTAAPPTLDFSAFESRNYTNIAPLLKQVFLIGQGFTTNGVPKTITVPSGATRLFLGTMDTKDWYNNSGSLTVEVATIGSATGITSSISMYPGISFSGVAGLSYEIDYAPSVGNTNLWSRLTTLILPSTPFTYCDVTATNTPMRFYRVFQLP